MKLITILFWIILFETFAVCPVNAVPIIFFAEDLHSDNAKNQFLSNLIDFGTETLEGHDLWTIGGPPMEPLNFDGLGSATVTGPKYVLGDQDNKALYIEDETGINFLNPISAFGFYSTGYSQGQLTIDLVDEETTITSIIVNDAHSVSNDYYWGFYDLENQYSKINYNFSCVDVCMGIDNLTIGTVANTPVPEPATILLMITGLFGLTGLPRKKGLKIT